MSKEPAGRFEQAPKLSIDSLAGRKNGLVKIELDVGSLPGQTAYLLLPIDKVIEGLVGFAAADSLEYVLEDAFSNGDAVKLTLARVVPKPTCPKCGTECG